MSIQSIFLFLASSGASRPFLSSSFSHLFQSISLSPFLPYLSLFSSPSRSLFFLTSSIIHLSVSDCINLTLQYYRSSCTSARLTVLFYLVNIRLDVARHLKHTRSVTLQLQLDSSRSHPVNFTLKWNLKLHNCPILEHHLQPCNI